MIRSLADRDATNRRLVSELEQQVLFDNLTGLPNRTLLQDRLRQTILAADRTAAQFVFILLDLDRFKDINDTFGHHVGDMLLQEVGPQIRSVLRESDTVARFGGDEFAILLTTTSDEAGATSTAMRILGRLQRLFVIEGLSLQVDASLGIAIYPLHGRDATALVQHADAAMYQAKRSKSGYAVYSVGEEEASRDRLVLLGELRDAIDHHQLSLHYQPMVDPAHRTVIGMESLVRWQHPRLGLLSAARFVPFAEQTGLIRPLGEWVLTAALAQCARWRSVGIDTAVAVNLSARDVPDPRFLERVERALLDADVPASRLKFEITEGVVMAEPTRSLEVLERLRSMSVELSIDDFGTGYSSLSYLKRLPVHEIKIDRTFIADMLNDRGAAAIVRSIVELGHNLGLRVIAEGVESAELADALASLGCDGLQGYYIGPPVPAEHIPAWLGGGIWTMKRVTRAEPIQLRPGRPY
jgi:diguanylate cyclase (GGDEF)-like protein